MEETFNLLRTVINEASKSQVFYQTHTWGNKTLITGIRNTERRNLIVLSDIKDKNVLDLGCATGAECIWAVENGANKAIGVDGGEKQITTFNNLIECLNPEMRDKLYGLRYDLNNGIPDNIKDVDTLFCFAITQHVRYRKLWREVPSVKVVYIEGGADSTYTESMLSDDLFMAKEIGRTHISISDPRPMRPLFRLTRL